MCVKGFMNGLAPLAKKLPVSLIFLEIFLLYGSVDGLGPFFIALF